jgi:hypothetical protein
MAEHRKKIMPLKKDFLIFIDPTRRLDGQLINPHVVIASNAPGEFICANLNPKTK